MKTRGEYSSSMVCLVLLDLVSFQWWFILNLLFSRKYAKAETLMTVTDAVHDIAFAPNLGRSFHVLAIATKDVRIFKLVPMRWLIINVRFLHLHIKHRTMFFHLRYYPVMHWTGRRARLQDQQSLRCRSWLSSTTTTLRCGVWAGTSPAPCWRHPGMTAACASGKVRSYVLSFVVFSFF